MKKCVAIMVLSLVFLTLVGCKGGKVKIDADGFEVNTIAVYKDGRVQGAILEEFDKDYYTKDALESFVADEINKYNEVNAEGEDPLISMESLKTGGGNARLVVSYASMEDYATFNAVEAKHMTLPDAKEAGLIPKKMVEAGTGNALEGGTIEGRDDAYVVSVEEECELMVQGKILYYQNGILLGEGRLQTADKGETTVVIYK